VSTAPSIVEPLLDVVGRDLEVPVLAGRTARHVNLDHAASTPPLQVVADGLARALPYYASVHRGAGYPSQVSTAAYEDARERIAAHVGARSTDITVVVRNTTDALNLLACSVPDEVTVVHLDVEHHANLLPWSRRRRQRAVPAAATVEATLASLELVVQDHSPALLSVTGASNVTGEALPLEEVVALARRHDARTVVDAAQLLPHRPVDLGASGIDYVVASGHKLYAPFGAGVLIGPADWLDAAPPYLAGGGAVREVDLSHVTWAKGPERHEAGSPNVLGAIAMAIACDELTRVGCQARRDHEGRLLEDLLELLTARSLPRLRIWQDDPSSNVGVVAFKVPGQDPGLVAARLAAEHGISVRDGRFCAHPLLRRLGAKEGALRVSLGIGSSSGDLHRLADGLDDVLGSLPSDLYELRDGRWRPANDRRPAPAWLPGGLAASGLPCGAERYDRARRTVVPVPLASTS
jgi:selenocysteine lyase/cysteine desulfurase